MPYTPRTRAELSEIALGAIIARSGLNDTAEGSVIHTLAQAIGALSASSERQIELVRAAYDFRNATGAELDERLGEFPPDTLSRHPATLARGVLTARFEALAAPQTISAGSSFGSSTNDALVYITTADSTAQTGDTSIELTAEASQAGTGGNIGAGVVDTILSAPSFIASIENQEPIAGGLDEETDAALKRRGLLYLASLARSQPQALESLAYNHTSTAGRVILAALWESPQTLGYSELYIDDGTGQLSAATATGTTYQGIAGATGVTRLYFDAPAAEAPTVLIDSGAGFSPLDPSLYIAQPERGVIYIEAGAIPSGTAYKLGAYSVYTGLIQELQSAIEGDTANPASSQGWRAAGTRVRVQPATPYRLDFDLALVVLAGYDLDSVAAAVNAALIELTYLLTIGAPLYVSHIINAIIETEGALNAHVYTAGTGSNPNPEPLADIYPPTNSVIRLGAVQIVPAAEET